MINEKPATLDSYTGKAYLSSTPTCFGGPLKCEGWFEPSDESARSEIGWRLLNDMNYEGYVVLHQENRIAKVNFKVSMPTDESYSPEDTGILPICGTLDQYLIPKA